MPRSHVPFVFLSTMFGAVASGCALLYDFEPSGAGGDASTSDASTDVTTSTRASAIEATASTATGGDPCVTGPYAACILAPGQPRPVVYFDFDGTMTSTIPSNPALPIDSLADHALADNGRLGQGLTISQPGRIRVLDDRVTEIVGGAVESTHAFAIELWFRVDELPAESETTTPFGFFSVVQGGEIEIFAADRGTGPGLPEIRFHRRTSTSIEDVIELDTAGSVIGALFHVVASFDGASLRLYVNGNTVAEVASPAPLPAKNNWQDAFFLGGDSNPAFPENDLSFLGMVDEVAIYDAPLSEDVVQVHCALGRGSPCVP